MHANFQKFLALWRFALLPTSEELRLRLEGNRISGDFKSTWTEGYENAG